MKQSFVVQEIIIQRKKKIVFLKKILAKTISHDAEISIRQEIHDEENDLEIFMDSEVL